ncbi:MAG: tyrosine-type recombinase/integrase [Streptosporangiaceae bacterium]
MLVNLFHAPLGQPMTPSAARQAFTSLSRRAGLAQPARPHMLRHPAGTGLSGAGAAIDVVQAVPGHQPVTSAQVYGHPGPSRARQAVEAAGKLSQERREQHRKGGQ